MRRGEHGAAKRQFAVRRRCRAGRDDDVAVEVTGDTVGQRGPSRYRFGASLEDEPFAVAHSGVNRARFLRGSNSFRAELARYYFDSTGGAASGGALTDAVNVLEGMALQADREPLHLRVARHGGAIVVNLAREDGRVV